MTINVTPIPRVIDLATPALTLGTSNAAGTAQTAISRDSTLLVFDTTTPAAVAASGAVGSATTAPRRDHVHAGTTLAAPALTLGTSNSAGAAATSFATNSTILAFDATTPADISDTAAAGSATVTARRDHVHEGWEEGTWTPVLSHGTTAAGSPAYSTQVGRYTKIGNRCYFNGTLTTSSISGLTGGNPAYILGLPFASINTSGGVGSGAIGEAGGLAITAGNTATVKNNPGTSYLRMMLWATTLGANTSLTITNWSADGSASFTGFYELA